VTGLETLRAGGKPALARALARLETAPGTGDVTDLLDTALAAPRGAALGLTGPPGVGKSTLIRALIAHWRGRGETVGVIAVDPSSRRSGGALLGDRTRLSTDPEDAGLFVRSMAARDRLGGVAEITYPAMVLMRALFDHVIVETVGVGQSETEIAELADVVVFCAQPGSGDALQFMKAGVMEIPDIVLVTKADLGELARRAAADLRGALSLAAGREGQAAPEVLTCSATQGEGIAALAEAIAAQAARISPARRQAQTAAWIEAHLVQRFGRVGAALLGDRAMPAAGPTPFRAATALAGRLEAALARLIEDEDAAPGQTAASRR